MSLTIKSKSTAKQLINFLASEYTVQSNIPVHLFSVVNASISAYNKMLGVTDGQGTIYFEAPKTFKCYGSGNPLNMLKALNSCNAGLKLI